MDQKAGGGKGLKRMEKIHVHQGKSLKLEGSYQKSIMENRDDFTV